MPRAFPMLLRGRVVACGSGNSDGVEFAGDLDVAMREMGIAFVWGFLLHVEALAC